MSETIVAEQELATPSSVTLPASKVENPCDENISAKDFTETTGPLDTATQRGQQHMSGLTDFPSERIQNSTVAEMSTGHLSSGQYGIAHQHQSNSSLHVMPPTALGVAQYHMSNTCPTVGFHMRGFTQKLTPVVINPPLVVSLPPKVPPLSMEVFPFQQMALKGPQPPAHSTYTTQPWLTNASWSSGIATNNIIPTANKSEISRVTAAATKTATDMLHARTSAQSLVTATAVGNETTVTSKPTTLKIKKGQAFSPPQFQERKVDAKLFPPRHFHMKKLEIGSWQYECNGTHKFFMVATSRIKVIFSQMKFVYEFVIDNQGMIAQFPGHFKQMACIEVPFTSIAGINIAYQSQQPSVVLIEVNQPPAMYLGQKILKSRKTGNTLPTQYNLMTPVDLTGGQLMTSPYHRISLISHRVNLMTRLSEFDPWFTALLQIPIVIEPNKQLISKQSPAARLSKRIATPVPKPAEAAKKQKVLESGGVDHWGCNCNSGCYTKHCTCTRREEKCSQTCKCMFCKNPLNILEKCGIDVHAAKKDICLMQNVYRIPDLRSIIRENVLQTPCCDSSVPLNECCIGVYQCPECAAEYRYSWCSADLCAEENRPRNHCAVCKTCRDHKDVHCSHCNKCYYAGAVGFPCPCQERGKGSDSRSS